MAYVRRRTTKAGALSTTLVESYRNKDGRPRQRLLANLHGAESTLHALAKLAAQRDRLRKERSTLEPSLAAAKEIYETVMRNTMAGAVYSDAARKELDPFFKNKEEAREARRRDRRTVG